MIWLAITACQVQSPTTSPVTRPTPSELSADLIAFTDERDGNLDIYTATAQIHMPDFGLEPLNLPELRSVQDTMDLTIDIAAQAAPGP